METLARSASLFLFMTSVLVLQVQAQERTVTGTVTAQDTGKTLPGVNIAVQGTTTGTATDLEGRYALTVPDDATLVFSAIGFIAQEVQVGDRDIIDVALAMDGQATRRRQR